MVHVIRENTMRKAGCFAVFLAASLAVSNAFAKHYSFPNVEITCRLSSNGTMRVHEKRTYSFSGPFSYAFRDFPHDSRVRFTNISVREGSNEYYRADTKEPGTFTVVENNGRKEVRWFYSAEDESRTFEILYDVEGAIQRHTDAAVLYFKFISDTWNKGAGHITIVIEPPAAITPDNVRFWLHGPMHAYSDVNDNGVVFGTCTDLPPYTYLEFRVLYAPDLFSEAPLKSGEIRQAVFNEEAAWAVRTNNMRKELIRKKKLREERKKKGVWIAGLLSVLGLGYWFSQYRRYGGKPKVSYIPDVSSDIPMDITPALASYLLYSRQINAASIMGTLFDLADRGIITIEEKPLEGGFFKRLSGKEYTFTLNNEIYAGRKQALHEYERELVDFMFNTLAESSGTISTKELQKKQSKFTKFFQKWSKKIKALGKSMEWFDQASIKAAYRSMICSGILFLLMVPVALYCGRCAIMTGLTGTVVFILSLLIMHRTEKGESLAQQLLAVKKYLTRYHFHSIGQDRLYANINKFVVYGTVLGLQKKHYTALIQAVPGDQFTRAVPWFIHVPGTAPSDMAASFTGMITAASSTMSSASGTGGGASAGGGGGASAGGGGAG